MRIEQKMKNGRHLTGVVDAELSIEQGHEAARYAALTSPAVIKCALGDLDRVEPAVQLIGFVNSARPWRATATRSKA